MTKLATMRGGYRVVAEIALGLILCAAVHASELKDVRLGVTEKRTRLVYQVDRLSTYQISFDDSSVRIRFDSLSVPTDLERDLNQDAGGLLSKITYDTENGETVFLLNIPSAFYLRYFELAKPERLVVDLYPQSQTHATAFAASPEEETTPKENPVEEEQVRLETEETQEIAGLSVATDSARSADEEAVVAVQQPSQSAPSEPEPKTAAPTTSTAAAESPIHWLYLALPIAIVLFAIGFIIIRRAARKEEYFEEDEGPKDLWPPPIKGFDESVGSGEQAEIEDVALDKIDRAFLDEREGLAEGSFEVPAEETPPTTSPEETKEPEGGFSIPKFKQKEGEEGEESSRSEVSKEFEKLRHKFSSFRYTEKTGEVDSVHDSLESADQDEVSEEVAATEEDESLPEEVHSDASEPLTELPSNDSSPEMPKLAMIGEESYRTALVDEDSIPEGSPRRKIHAADGDNPDLNFLDADLTWPVHILDGERAGRIMVIDDEPEIVAALERFLDREEYDVLALTDSSSAVERYKDWHPDLVITDVVMPQLSGVDLIQKIREENGLRKVIFLSGRAERDSVSKVFAQELEEGKYEFFRKPLSLVQIGGRIRDYFSSALETLHLNLQDPKNFDARLEHLGPYQLVTLQRFFWDKIFEISANLLGRRIEPYFITDRMEPATNFMRRMGCQEREDYCVANVCFASNPSCAATKIRSEIEIMRQIVMEFRQEYKDHVSRSRDQEEQSEKPSRKHGRSAPQKRAKVAAEAPMATPPERRTLRRLVPTRNR